MENKSKRKTGADKLCNQRLKGLQNSVAKCGEITDRFLTKTWKGQDTGPSTSAVTGGTLFIVHSEEDDEE